MKKAKEKAVEAGKESLSYYYCHKFDKKYEELIKLARVENPLPETTEKKRGRKKKGKRDTMHMRQLKMQFQETRISSLDREF